MSENKNISTQQAINLMTDGEYIHTIRNPNVGIMIGADWKREELIALMDEKGVELSGEVATKMNHGLCIRDNGFLFVATKAKDPAP